MARPLRTDFPGAHHHVMNRGARVAPVFVDDVCCTVFLDLVSELPARYGVVVHGYALMPNHFHLMVETPRANLSRAMRHLLGNYTIRVNQIHGWDGPVFRGRFKSVLVTDDAHWMHLLAYLHLNPVKANLVRNVDRASWTSHAAYAGRVRPPDWLTCGPLLEAFGSVAAYRQYVRDVRTGRASPPSDFDEDALWRRPSESALQTSMASAPAPAVIEREQALADVTRLTGASLADLATARRGRAGNPPRWLALWWLTRGAGLGIGEAGRLLGMSGQSASRTLASLSTARGRHPDLDGWIETLERRGQTPGTRGA